ncbi:MAG: NADP-dependent methylenetetrahydromethanopterin/methylenetetrahydrofolate dehydrogenase [Planctomycetota bacterium]
MDKKKILIQLDNDAQPSVFDRVVAIDAGVDELFSYGGVQLDQIRGLVHGAIFTRKPSDLKRTAIFVGGSDVALGEKMLAEATKSMLSFLKVSVMLDSNGANTTAAAAVRVAGKHLTLKGTKALVLGGTGPVGQRVARLLAMEGAEVRVGSRQTSRAEQVCKDIAGRFPSAKLTPVATGTPTELTTAVAGQTLIVAAGAAGVVLLPKAVRDGASSLKVAIDLNAVPPVGIEGVDVMEQGGAKEGVILYGAIGVGGLKMKLHRAAIAQLFEANDRVLDAEEIYALGANL